MAKLAVINRGEKRRKLVEKYAKKRAELVARVNDQSLSVEERFEARLKVQALPRNSSHVQRVIAKPGEEQAVGIYILLDDAGRTDGAAERR